MVRMLTFRAAESRSASSVPEVSAPFHIGHCARAALGSARASSPAVAKTSTTCGIASALMSGSVDSPCRLCQTDSSPSGGYTGRVRVMVLLPASFSVSRMTYNR